MARFLRRCGQSPPSQPEDPPAVGGVGVGTRTLCPWCLSKTYATEAVPCCGRRAGISRAARVSPQRRRSGWHEFSFRREISTARFLAREYEENQVAGIKLLELSDHFTRRVTSGPGRRHLSLTLFYLSVEEDAAFTMRPLGR